MVQHARRRDEFLNAQDTSWPTCKIGTVTTQEERSSVTREKTIAATIDCLIELGYHGATVAAVAERAGISRGAVSHQYPDKSRLVTISGQFWPSGGLHPSPSHLN